MNTESTQTPESLGSPSGSASDLLAQWQLANKERDEALERRKYNWMMPRIGLEEAIEMHGMDLNQAMWFLDKTLKLLASLESQEND